MPHKDPEAARRYQARYQLLNKERLLRQKADYYERNREQINEKKREPQRISQAQRRKENPLYYIYQAVLSRCDNPNNSGYYLYGARDVRVCDEWRLSFEAFKKWMLANGWQKGLQIDRMDPDGDYTPQNCRVVTNQINSQNRRTTKLSVEKVIEIRELLDTGQTQQSIADKYGVSRSLINTVKRGIIWRNASWPAR